MPTQQGGMPITWVDSMAPSFGLQASGAASPGTSTYVGTAPNELVLNTYAGGTNDRAFGVIQFNHDLRIGSTGTNVTFSPHVHWTCSTSPTTNTFVEWKCCYVHAKPGVTFAAAGQFSSAVLTSTGRTTVPATTAAFERRHMITELQDVTVASSVVAASHLAIVSIQVSSASTLDVTPMLLSFDIHYQSKSAGTNGEWT